MGRSSTSIAKIQHISRQYVYDLVAKYKTERELAYKVKSSGRPKQPINPVFIGKVIKIRKEDDYGGEKIVFV